MIKILALVLVASASTASIALGARPPRYSARGIGGGGAMSGFSISPYANLRFVGTDMGTLFRSTDGGRTWTGIDQRQTGFSTDLAHTCDVGFSADGLTIFHAVAGRDPRRSSDSGVTFSDMPMPLLPNEHIRYWVSDPREAGTLLAATDLGLLATADKGDSWTRIDAVKGEAVGTFLRRTESGKRTIFHATPDRVWLASAGLAFHSWYEPPAKKTIRAFAGGASATELTLAFIDNDGHHACGWAHGNAATEASCGYVWTARLDGRADSVSPNFAATTKDGGTFVRMAGNDPRTIYVTGGNWIRQYGAKIWVSPDRGASWPLAFNLYDWDQHPYRPWPKDKLEYSAVGLDVGWDDNTYYSFNVNPLDSAEAGGTGNYFLHTTRDRGRTWQAPFTAFADSGDRTKGKRWRSTGLEVTSALKLKFNPANPKLGYVAMADLGGLVTEDGGETWRVCKAQYNTNYDYAFDPAHPDWVYAASGAVHDFPLNQHAAVKAEGGVYLSKDRGRAWTRLTPAGGAWNRQFLSVAFDSKSGTLYGGTQGGGIARSLDGGKRWTAFNTGLFSETAIVPQLEVDPETGDVYALATDDTPDFRNHERTGIYVVTVHPSKELQSLTTPTHVALGSEASWHWELLRGQVEKPSEVDKKYAPWYFPTAFAIDFSSKSRSTLWLADMESNGAWLASGVWKSTDRGRTWRRSLQFTHPTALTLDPRKPERVFATGPLAPNWGRGGAFITDNGGDDWHENEKLPYPKSVDGVTLDPASSASGASPVSKDNAFYLFFGNAMLYGPAR